MNFFKKLFGIGGKENNAFGTRSKDDIVFQKQDQENIISAKFFIMVSTEEADEAPKLNDINEILDSFPEELKVQAFNLCTFSIYAHDLSQESNDKGQFWKNVFENFCSQFENFNRKAQESILRDIASIGFGLKAQDDMKEFAEAFVYRMMHFEPFLKMEKSEYIALLEEEKANQGADE
ncbi:hypothetical protein OAF64_08830 [Crocinitomicaceae bacterium]|nr:hypothetical protein [Crocinitomicaceae bacterium]